MAYDPSPIEAGSKAMFNLANEYLKAANILKEHHMTTLMPHGPLYYLITHAYELFTKSFLLEKGLNYADLRKIGHSPIKLLEKCKELGMDIGPSDQIMAEVSKNLNAHNMQRYPMLGLFQLGPQGFCEPENLLAFLDSYKQRTEEQICNKEDKKKIA